VDIAQSQRSGDWAQAITAVKANGDIKPAALVEHRSKGRPGVVDGAPAAEAGRPGASVAPKTLISRSLWPAGQDEGAKRNVDIALSQRERRLGLGQNGGKSHG